jgi:hypothetical protein
MRALAAAGKKQHRISSVLAMQVAEEALCFGLPPYVSG